MSESIHKLRLVGIYEGDQLRGGLFAVQDDLKNLKTATESTAAGTDRLGSSTSDLNKSLENGTLSFGALRTAIKGAGITLAAKKVADLALEFDGLYQAQERATKTLAAYADGTDGAAQGIKQMKDALEGTVSKTQAAALSGQLLRLEIVGSTEEAAKFARNMALIGDTSQTVEQNVGNAIAAAVNQSYLRLDTLGISSANVRARVDELTAATSGLSNEQAFSIAMMEEAEIAARRLEGAGVGLANSQQELAAKTADTKAALGELFNPVVESSIDLVMEFEQVLMDGAAALDNYLERIAKQRDAMVEETGRGFRPTSPLHSTESMEAEARYQELIKETARIEDELYAERRLHKQDDIALTQQEVDAIQRRARAQAEFNIQRRQELEAAVLAAGASIQEQTATLAAAQATDAATASLAGHADAIGTSTVVTESAIATMAAQAEAMGFTEETARRMAEAQALAGSSSLYLGDSALYSGDASAYAADNLFVMTREAYANADAAYTAEGTHLNLARAEGIVEGASYAAGDALFDASGQMYAASDAAYVARDGALSLVDGLSAVMQMASSTSAAIAAYNAAIAKQDPAAAYQQQINRLKGLSSLKVPPIKIDIPFVGDISIPDVVGQVERATGIIEAQNELERLQKQIQRDFDAQVRDAQRASSATGRSATSAGRSIGTSYERGASAGSRAVKGLAADSINSFGEISDEMRLLESYFGEAAYSMSDDQRKAALESLQAWQGATDKIGQAMDTVRGSIRSTVSSSISLGYDGPSAEDALLDMFGLRIEGPNEIQRRLQDIVNQGSASPWFEQYAEALGLFGGSQDEIKARAIRAMQDFEAGLLPDLIDKEAIKAQVRRQLKGQANLDRIIDEVTEELLAEGVGADKLQKALQAEFGDAIGRAAPDLIFEPRLLLGQRLELVGAGDISPVEILEGQFRDLLADRPLLLSPPVEVEPLFTPETADSLLLSSQPLVSRAMRTGFGQSAPDAMDGLLQGLQIALDTNKLKFEMLGETMGGYMATGMAKRVADTVAGAIMEAIADGLEGAI